jgi:hypothetical protein
MGMEELKYVQFDERLTHGGEPAEITGVVIAPIGEGALGLCYRVRWEDGTVATVPVGDPTIHFVDAQGHLYPPPPPARPAAQAGAGDKFWNTVNGIETILAEAKGKPLSRREIVGRLRAIYEEAEPVWRSDGLRCLSMLGLLISDMDDAAAADVQGAMSTGPPPPRPDGLDLGFAIENRWPKVDRCPACLGRRYGSRECSSCRRAWPRTVAEQEEVDLALAALREEFSQLDGTRAGEAVWLGLGSRLREAAERGTIHDLNPPTCQVDPRLLTEAAGHIEALEAAHSPCISDRPAHPVVTGRDRNGVSIDRDAFLRP